MQYAIKIRNPLNFLISKPQARDRLKELGVIRAKELRWGLDSTDSRLQKYHSHSSICVVFWNKRIYLQWKRIKINVTTIKPHSFRKFLILWSMPFHSLLSSRMPYGQIVASQHLGSAKHTFLYTNVSLHSFHRCAGLSPNSKATCPKEARIMARGPL
jgi:hypothetical protein